MRWIGVLAMVVALGLVTAGCGGSKDSESAPPAESVATETTTDETFTDETSTVETSTEETSTDGGDVLGALSGECKSLVEAGQAFGAALSSAAGNGTGDDLGATAEAYKAFADNAPEELKDDFETLAAVIGEYASAIGDLGLKAGETPSASQIAKLVALSNSFNSTDVQDASTAISNWTTENCSP